MNKDNNLIAVCSGTKGIGKTWFSSNLCHCLALMKKKVLLFDADCGLENITQHLNLEQKVSYTRLLKGTLPLNNAVFRYDKGRFDIICATSEEKNLSSMAVGRIQALAQDLRHFSKYYDFVIVDCAHDNSIVSNIFLNACRNFFMMVNAEPNSLISTYTKLEEIKKIMPDMRGNIIINRAFSYDEGSQIYKSLLQAAEEYIKIKLNLFGIIRQDTRIRDAVLNHSLLLNRYSSCEGAEDILAISKRLLEEFK